MFKWFRKDNPDSRQPPASVATPAAAADAAGEVRDPVADALLWFPADAFVAVVPRDEPAPADPAVLIADVDAAHDPTERLVSDTPAIAPVPVQEQAPDFESSLSPPSPDVAAPAVVDAPTLTTPPTLTTAPTLAEPQVDAPAATPATVDSPAEFDSIPALFSADPVPAAPEAVKPRTLRERLAATARALTASVGNLFKRNPKLDEDLLEELETALIQADIGVTASTELVEQLRVRMRKREFADASALLAALRLQLRGLIVAYAKPLVIPQAPRPFVILTVGVNGAGKTTTIGKLAMRYKLAGHSVMLAAGDTFRAAAVEQLKTWGERNQVAVIAQGSGADSASVIFDAFQAAKSRGIDVLIADTAGRLHTQGHLMQELAKVKRVLGKIDASAPHETLLVIDGGTGQNALNQAKQFHQAVGLSGIVVTKLDGTAKGGMVFAVCRELGLPIRFIGVGEKREDLREFIADDFVDALLPRDIGV